MNAVANSNAVHTFRRRVLEVLASKGISRSGLATRLGVSIPTVSALLNSDEGITLDRAERVAKAIGTPLHELLCAK
jgi:transcriptional regulator with XRE-family HTH domain